MWYGYSFCLLLTFTWHFNRKIGGFIQYTTSGESHLFFSSVCITCHCERFYVFILVRILLVCLLRVLLRSFLLNFLAGIFFFVFWWWLSFYSMFLDLLLEHFVHMLCQLANLKKLFRGNLSAAVVRNVSGNFQRPVQDLIINLFDDSGKVLKILVHPSAKQWDCQAIHGSFARILW